MAPPVDARLERTRFDQPEMWGRLEADPNIQRKVQALEQMIPRDVRTIVDVGCGDGGITNRLAKRYEVTGVDKSEAALAHLRTTVVRASCEELPFAEAEFDLALSSELLEHLGERSYGRSLKEIQRVARRYVLISVPYREQLNFRTVRCPRCGWTGHVWGHRRSFTIDSLLSDLEDLVPVDVRIFGPPQEPRWPRSFLWTSHRLLGRFYYTDGQFPLCEHCGNTDFTQSRGYPQAMLSSKVLYDRIRARPRLPFWLAVVAERG